MAELRDINKALIEVNSREDKKDTAVFMISSNTNWGEFLFPAPKAIATLGQLMLISTAKDFSMKNQEPLNGFRYMEHPGSFRASLVQVSNSGWRAFNEAQKVNDLKFS